MKRKLLLTGVLLSCLPAVCMAQPEIEGLIQVGKAVTGGGKISSEITNALTRTAMEQIRATEEAANAVLTNLPKMGVEQTRVAKEASAGTTNVPGVGTVRSFSVTGDLNIDYGLEVPTRRGHTDHFVPMDLEKIIQRWDINYKNVDLQTRWQEIGGKMEYNNQQSLVQDIHRLYEGQGIPAQEILTKQDVLIYTLPFDGIVYSGHAQSQSLQKKDAIVVFYPKRNRGQLVKFDKDGLRFYRLKPDTVVEP
ncbi:hypothetical protein [Candidatus Avelusimicrobium luingense]|uniref:hypothetical protein n=1 Tax=Candidatus Avelusimicrobium luingense TaxID=3416211 RepID=UPI003D0DD590